MACSLCFLRIGSTTRFAKSRRVLAGSAMVAGGQLIRGEQDGCEVGVRRGGLRRIGQGAVVGLWLGTGERSSESVSEDRVSNGVSKRASERSSERVIE